MLRDYDCVELVRTEPRRGALQHFYRATARPNFDEDQWRTLPSGLRRELAGETIQELVDDLAAASDAGMLEDPEIVVTRTPIELDERGFKKLNKLLAKTHEQALSIASESAARGADGAEVFPTEVALMHFRRAQPGGGDRNRDGPAVRRRGRGRLHGPAGRAGAVQRHVVV
jgi:hypothetical protein